jgi:hypothetical protein
MLHMLEQYNYINDRDYKRTCLNSNISTFLTKIMNLLVLIGL